MIDRTFDPNLAMLETATETLGELCDSLVFIGGCATGLLLTASRAHSIRATKDIDVVTKVTTIRGYHTVEKNSLSADSNTTLHRMRRSVVGSAPALRST